MVIRNAEIGMRNENQNNRTAERQNNRTAEGANVRSSATRNYERQTLSDGIADCRMQNAELKQKDNQNMIITLSKKSVFYSAFRNPKSALQSCHLWTCQINGPDNQGGM
jgi:hypothetical protein